MLKFVNAGAKISIFNHKIIYLKISVLKFDIILIFGSDIITIIYVFGVKRSMIIV